ncbi:SMI1/KNR4 family protein [Streptomyces sp. NPDC026672]|uniref:SMI1/KNR4 family protein n=1 Tax=unclassified Streptomyces TaxID=2593676 RepID=UPI0033DD22C3
MEISVLEEQGKGLLMTNGLQTAVQVIGLVRENEGLAHHGNGCSPEMIARAESELALVFPPSYRHLIEEFGTWDVPPTEFLGVYQTPAGGEELLGTPAYTKADREALGLPHHFMVVMHDDVWGVVVLDTSQPDKDGEYPIFAWNPGVLDGGLMEKIADSFGEFALKACQQNLN